MFLGLGIEEISVLLLIQCVFWVEFRSIEAFVDVWPCFIAKFEKKLVFVFKSEI